MPDLVFPSKMLPSRSRRPRVVRRGEPSRETYEGSITSGPRRRGVVDRRAPPTRANACMEEGRPSHATNHHARHGVAAEYLRVRGSNELRGIVTLARSISMLLAALVGTSMACDSDPVRERAIAELGEESASVPPGPLHRPGQACGLCHGAAGPAKSVFVLSGTVYATPTGSKPVAGVKVRVIDWVGAQWSTVTNCAGNFFVRNDEFTPKWPVWFRIEQEQRSAEMQSASFREGSCNACHAAEATPRTTHHVYLSDEDFVPPDVGCR